MRRRGVRRGREGALDVSPGTEGALDVSPGTEGALDVSPHEPRSLVSTKSAIKIPYVLAAISTIWECTV